MCMGGQQSQGYGTPTMNGAAPWQQGMQGAQGNSGNTQPWQQMQQNAMAAPMPSFMQRPQMQMPQYGGSNMQGQLSTSGAQGAYNPNAGNYGAMSPEQETDMQNNHPTLWSMRQNYLGKSGGGLLGKQPMPIEGPTGFRTY